MVRRGPKTARGAEREEKALPTTATNTFPMKKLIIKTCEKSKWLRKEALIAIEEWEADLAEREEGVLSGALNLITTNKGAEYQISPIKQKLASFVM